uniref:tRNA (adenine(58)-N(1))-methyltransferase n=1 Tax=Albugo laibachii Nc14 TaxID=890382 RepID=F0W5W3_9STRA|nr:tRNA (adenineN(1))methyltransferase catalytic subunit putative [Albugo laibachii Nc14]|eukprot:CCA16504.1 tRNA (adenineN(1))methyltransferase catalytic subunit putative [Albugo laibachii Nc14]
MLSPDVNDKVIESIPNSMWEMQSKVIEEGSLVILFENHTSLTYCYVKRQEIFQNRHGAFHHNDMIGKPFGSTITSRKKDCRGYMILLAPTPELWSRALRHRTQIVFTSDASAIIFQTSLKCGSRVLEAGTGSGALTTSFARTVAPTGHVYTFEFNATRADIATKEFACNGMEKLITVNCRDVCADGFPEALVDSTDVVFLDLPCPWKAIPNATKILKQGGRFASYSPCLEQVQKTCDALREEGYELIKTIETRVIPYSVRNIESKVLKCPEEEEKVASNGLQIIESIRLKKRQKQFDAQMIPNLVAKKDDEIRGHTAFLTFACKFF